MSWPATNGVTVGYAASGITTIRWGTDGLLQSPKPSVGYYTVIRFNERPLVDNQKLPNGTGVTSTRVLIKDGVEFSLTVRDDTQMIAPVPGSTAAIVDAAGLLGTIGLVYTCTIIDPSYDTAVKQAGERVIMAENLILIESQVGAAQV